MKRVSLILLVLISLSAFGNRPSPGNRHQPQRSFQSTPSKTQSPCVADTIAMIKEKLASIHELKGTFETLFPIENHSIAKRFPGMYALILQLFHDRPSHLVGMNRGNPPKKGMPLSDIYKNINRFSWEIGNKIDFYAKHSMPQGDDGRAIIDKYVTLFKKRKAKEDTLGVFDPTNREQLAEITRYGKGVICATWAELRLSLRIGRISQVNIKIEELIEQGVLPDPLGLFRKHMDQEIDHLWFPRYTPSGLTLADVEEADDEIQYPELNYQPDAVAVGETKVFDVPFDDKYDWKKRRKVHEQFNRLLEVSSRIGAQFGLPAELYYFFVAGISKAERQTLFDMAAEFNSQRPNDLRTVKLFVYGVYGGH